MHAKILFFVAVLALAALTLAGCSGGGGGSAQTPVAGVSRGVITKTGSVFVNGVEFDSKNATMIMDDPPVLGPGMVVTVKGVVFDDTHGKASSVEFADNLNGPIAAFNNLSSSMTVLGQKVKFVPGTTVFANFSGAGTIGVRPGEMVQVSGFTDPAGVIQATRIDRHLPDWAPSTIVELKGTISSRPSATTFTIGGLTVDFTGLFLPTGVDVGSSVQVMGTIQALTSTRLSATSITPIGDDFSDIDCAKNRTVVEGIVSNLAGNTFMVGSVPVISTVSLSGVANGVLVKVTGSLVNGFLIAKAITVETPTVPTTVPAAPSAVTAVGGVNQVTISWNAVAGATSYNIYWSTTTGVTTANGTKISNAISPYVQTGLTAGTTYFYVVTAVNAIGEGPPSSQVSAVPTSVPVAPPAPIGVSAVGSGATSATVSWAAVSGATSYNIYYATTAGVTIGGAGVTKLTGVTSPDTVTGLTAATTYFFIVTAVNSAGESVPSIEVSATTAAAGVPTAPTGVAAVGGTNQVTVSWTAVAGATSYNIYYSTTTGVTPATGTLIAGATSPSIVTGLAASTTYFFVVTAVNASGESAPSAQASATTAATVAVPTAPTGVTAVGGANQVTVTWSAVAGATSYNIYYATTAGVTIGGAGVTKLTSVTSPDIVMGLAASTTYFFIVTAVNSAGESLPSAEVSATTSVPALDGAALYSANCAGCHNALASSNVRMRTAAQITTAIANNTGGMGFLSSVLSAAQITAIANALNF